MPRKTPKPARKRIGQITEKGEGKFLIRWYVGLDANKKRIYNSEIVEGTYKQAGDALAKKTVAKSAGTLVATTKVSVCEYLTGHKTRKELSQAIEKAKSKGLNVTTAYKGWLGGRVGVAPKTHHGYCERIRMDALPLIGHHRLDGLSRGILQLFIANLAEQMTDDETPRLSRRTIQYTVGILRQAFKQAVMDGVLARNPTDGLELPMKEFSETSVLDVGQIGTLLTKTTDPLRCALWNVLLTAGLRPQEALALTWDDIDVESSTLAIRRAMVETTPGHWEVGTPKTKGSTRTVVVPQETMGALKEHRVEQSKQILKAGTHYDRQGIVFAGKHGQHLDMSALRRRWKADLKAAGLPPRRLYDSRHSHFTALIAAGVHVKVAQERGGWSTPKTLLDTYSHVLPSMQQAASDLVGSLIFAPTRTATGN